MKLPLPLASVLLLLVGALPLQAQPGAEIAGQRDVKQQVEDWKAQQLSLEKELAEHPIVPNDLVNAALKIVEQDLEDATTRQDKDGITICLQMLDRLWSQGSAFHNVDAVVRIEAEDFVCTDPSGAVTHKSDDLEAAKSDALQLAELKMEDFKVSLYGDSAVITGKSTFSGTAHDQPISGSYRWTDVFVKRDGHWQVVASQATTIAPSMR